MFAFIKVCLVRLVAIFTGRKCNRCEYSRRGHCIHPDGQMYGRCFNSFTRPGYEKYSPRYLDTKEKRREQLLATGRAAGEGFVEGMKAAQLTPEQQHQLEKIKATLQQAEDTARESGLLED